jgi:ribosome-binding protein aMBF1 (putative translation factor)
LMAMTNAERHARWRARHKQELAELRAKSARPGYSPAVLSIVSSSAPLPANVRKASSNQYDRRDGKQEAPIRRAIPNAEIAKKAFGNRMREARLAAGLSQAQVAMALFGSGQVYIKRYINWEIGRSPMALEVIPVFARLLGTDCNFLLTGAIARIKKQKQNLN